MSGAKSSTATATTATDRAAREAVYVGRFAPSPSGDLHLGSLYTAVASYLDARAHGGRWLVRIEDLDRPREVAGSADRIIATLTRFGFDWDGPIVRQRDRARQYAVALETLHQRHLTFACSCSRQKLADDERYPGTCRSRPGPSPAATAIRLRVAPGFVTFTDRIHGMYRQEVSAAVGDLILRRRDGIIAYLLAVVVDDADQGVTHIVRGADLLDNTPRQIYLQRQLAYPLPEYAHVPVLTEADGSKLAKSSRSISLDSAPPMPQLLRILQLLDLSPPNSLRDGTIPDVWRWAIASWRIKRLPKRLHVPVSD